MTTTDLDRYRRSVMQARIDRAHRDLALAQADARRDAEDIAALRRFPGTDPAHAAEANAFADVMEAENAAKLAAATANLQAARAELDALWKS